MRKQNCVIALLLFALCLPVAAQWPMMNRRPWDKGAFETRQYRNLFVEMGYSQQAVEAKLQEVFNDVFVGPNKVYF